MIIDLVRHGKSVDNEKGLVSGSSQTPLSPAGVAQAQAFTSDLVYDVIFCSTLPRALQTAQIIRQKFPQANYIETKLLVEKDYGIIEGHSWSELSVEFPQFSDVYEVADHPEVTKGETLESLDRRTQEFVGMVKDLSVKNILVITHGGILRHLARAFQGLSDSEVQNLHPNNLEIYRITKSL